MAGLADHLVKFRVAAREPADIALVQRFDAVVNRALQFDTLRVVHAPRGQSCRDGFEFVQQFKHVAQLRDRHLGDEHALTGHDLYILLRGKLLQCLANRRAGHVKARGERALIERRARGELAPLDLRFENRLDFDRTALFGWLIH